MPWIDDEEDKARQKKFEMERAIKNKLKANAFNKLTASQQEAIRIVWRAYNQWDTDSDDMGGDVFHSTYLNLKKVRHNFYQAFPTVTQVKDE